MSKITSLTYVAKDGNYGDAAGLTVIDTTDWTSDDFDMVDRASDDQRVLAAQTVSEWIERGRTDEYDEFFARLGIERS